MWQGAYRISESVRLSAVGRPIPPSLRGQGNAIVHMTNPQLDVFVGTALTNWRCSGLTIVGGRNQLVRGHGNARRHAQTINISICFFVSVMKS